MSTPSDPQPPGGTGGTGGPIARRIVVGVDGSASSVDALRWAARLGTALDLGLEAVITWEYPASYGMAGGTAEWRPDLDADAVLAEALDTAFGDARPAGLQTRTREGQPAGLLIDMSADAEMLVVGSRGRGGFTGLLLGSVSTHCAEHARCPVVVVHTRTGDPRA